MAFTGTPTIKQISDSEVRITGLSLIAGATGTIGLAGATGSAPDVEIPESFKTEHYTYGGQPVTFQDAIEAIAIPAATGVATAIPVSIVKTGTTVGDFRISFTNTQGSLATPDLEIYVRYH